MEWQALADPIQLRHLALLHVEPLHPEHGHIVHSRLRRAQRTCAHNVWAQVVAPIGKRSSIYEGLGVAVLLSIALTR